MESVKKKQSDITKTEEFKLINEEMSNMILSLNAGMKDTMVSAAKEIGESATNAAQMQKEILELSMTGIRTQVQNDMADMRTEMQNDMADMKTEMKEDIRAEIGGFKQQISGQFGEMMKFLQEMKKS